MASSTNVSIDFGRYMRMLGELNADSESEGPFFDYGQFIDTSTTIREQNRRKLFISVVGIPCRTAVRRSAKNDMFHRWEATTSTQGHPIFYQRDAGKLPCFGYL